MASVKNLKKDINFVLADIIEECYAWQLVNAEKDDFKAEEIIDEAIATFDSLIEEVNAKNIENKKAHFNTIQSKLVAKGNELIAKINAL